MDKRSIARLISVLTAVVFLLAACDLTPMENKIASLWGDRLMTEESGTATAKIATNTPTPSETPSGIPPTPCKQINPSFAGPVVCAFTANFVQENFSTFYTVVAVDPAGGALTYTWSNSNPCGNFVAGNKPKVYWAHPDSDKPGACPVQNIHPGTITVIIKSAGGSVKCEYLNGSAPGDIVQCVNQ